MSQRVPSWDLDGHPTPPNSFAPDMLRYEVAELTWENGQPSMHGLGPLRVHTKSPTTAAASFPTNYTWEKPRAGGTLESIVGQATSFPQGKTSAADSGGDNELVPWFDRHRRAAPSDTATMSMDALVPCSTTAQEEASTHLHSSTCVMDCSTRVESFSAAANTLDGRVARAPPTASVAAREWSSQDNNSVSGSAKLGRDNRQFTLDSGEREFSVGWFTSTSLGSPENNISGREGTKVTATDDHDSVCQSRPQMEAGGEEEGKKKLARKVSTPTKKRRAAAIHNQSERKRRDKINQRMKTLQKMIPNSSKTDKASMLDEVIQYLKQLKAQVQMMSTMSMPYVMMPMALQQQLHQLSMMGMGIGMGMGMGVMDMNTIGRPNIAGIPPVLHPSSAFMPQPFWNGSGCDHLTASASEMPGPRPHSLLVSHSP